MPVSRRKISAVVRDFSQEIKKLERFDAENQAKFTSIPCMIPKTQLHFLTEAIFSRAFRAYECLVRDTFLLYTLEKRPRSGARVTSYLKPRNFLHAETLIQSSLRYLQWSSPDIVIERAEIYLEDGFPIKLPLTTNSLPLHDFRKIRNHIAHNSKKSLDDYKSVLRQHFTTIPLSIPTPGEFLLLSDRIDPSKYKLLVFFELMNSLMGDLS